MLVIGIAVGAVVAAGVLVPNRRFVVRVAAVLLALAALLLVSVILWRQALVALTIVALFALALGVLFQKVPPSRAMAAAVVALFLIFAFTWLTRRLSEVFLFAPRHQPILLLQQWLDGTSIQMDGLFGLDSSLLLIVGLALLAIGPLLKSWMRALAIFAGIVFTGLWARAVFPEPDLGLELAPVFRDPLVQGTLVAVIVAGLMHWLFTMGPSEGIRVRGFVFLRSCDENALEAGWPTGGSWHGLRPWAQF